MTVKELIEQLQGLPQDLTVYAEGNNIMRVSHRKGMGYENIVLTTREYYERKRECYWNREPQDEEEYDYGEE